MRNFSYELQDDNQMKTEYLLISVIIPTYNCGSFISAAIESVFRQTYPAESIEVIVVDDGSEDNTSEILKTYGERSIHIHQGNEGIASARNRGISVARGEIITFLDADDIWCPSRLQRIAEKFISEECTGIVYHPIAFVSRDGVISCSNFLKAYGYREGVYGEITKELITGRIFCGGSSFVFRRETVERIFPLPEDIRGGVDYYMTVMASCDELAEYVPDILGAYRLRRGNISMFAGFETPNDLSRVYGDFAHTHLRVCQRLKQLENVRNYSQEIDILMRRHIHELIFSHVLGGRRYDAIAALPFLFRAIDSPLALVLAISILVLTLFLPKSLFYSVLRLKAKVSTAMVLSKEKAETNFDKD